MTRPHARCWLPAVVVWACAPAAVMAADAGVAAASAAPAPVRCGDALDGRHRHVLPSSRVNLAYAPLPAPLVSGRHFGLEIVVCPRAGTPLPVALRVDADMPAHGHGMNYRPTVRALGEGRYRAEGLMLHMAGRWRLLFDVSIDGRIERLSHEVNLP